MRLEQTTSCTVKFCPYEVCSDNAVMIAIAALYTVQLEMHGNFEYSKVTNYANVDDKTTLDYFAIMMLNVLRRCSRILVLFS